MISRVEKYIFQLKKPSKNQSQHILDKLSRFENVRNVKNGSVGSENPFLMSLQQHKSLLPHPDVTRYVKISFGVATKI